MVKRFIDLTDDQQKNIFFFLDKAQNHELNNLRKKYEFKLGKSLVDSRENVLHALMMEQIDFNFFINWLSNVYLEGNNTLFVYESDDNNTFSQKNKTKMIKNAKKIKKYIYDINVETLNDITLVNIEENDSQIVLTFAAPSLVIQERQRGTVPDVTKDVYLAYIFVDYVTEQVILSMHPSHNLYSICGIKKKRDLEPIATQFINFFRKNILAFNFSNPDWIFDALFDITEEYFDHNNPIITKKVESFKKNVLSTVIDEFSKIEESFKTGASNLRIKKALIELLENQLIAKYGTIPKETPFKVFLHETGKGVTSFKADSKGKALSFADSYEIVKKMIENADIASLGITYIENEKEFPYKIVKGNNCYSLKRITTATTEKEIVDNVLRQLKKYKPGEKSENSRGQFEDYQ
jgi:hypothetical protein